MASQSTSFTSILWVMPPVVLGLGMPGERISTDATASMDSDGYLSGCELLECTVLTEDSSLTVRSYGRWRVSTVSIAPTQPDNNWVIEVAEW